MPRAAGPGGSMGATRLLLLLAATATLPGRAAGETPGDDEGMFLAVRGGWALPFGDLSPGAPLEDVADAKLPLGVEVGYRFGAHVRGALYLEFAPASLASDCPPGASCTGYDGRFGVLVQLHPLPRSWLDPWIAVGFGIEHLRTETPPPGGVTPWTSSWLGLEVPVEAGLDLRVSSAVSFGPFVSASAAQFTSATTRPPGGPSASGEIEERATHGWLQAGLRLGVKL